MKLFLTAGTPIVNRPGEFCGLCDSGRPHSHPQFKCPRCGAEGLTENYPMHEKSCLGLNTPLPKNEAAPGFEELLAAQVRRDFHVVFYLTFGVMICQMNAHGDQERIYEGEGPTPLAALKAAVAASEGKEKGQP